MKSGCLLEAKVWSCALGGSEFPQLALKETPAQQGGKSSAAERCREVVWLSDSRPPVSPERTLGCLKHHRWSPRAYRTSAESQLLSEAHSTSQDLSSHETQAKARCFSVVDFWS